MIKRLIFDVDNTLITNVNFSKSIEETLKQINLYSKENVQSFLNGIKSYEKKYNNYNVDDYVNHMQQTIGKSLPHDFLDIFFENLKSAIPGKNQRLIDTISKLSQKYELVLLTNYFSKSQLNRLNNMGIGQFFSECHGEKLIKPNFDAYINACGLNMPSECVMIGDDIFLDIECATKIGMNTIFVNSKNVSTNNINTITVNNVEEITETLIETLDCSDSNYIKQMTV